MNIQDYIAIYAAGLSTFLAVRQIYVKRRRIRTSFFFTGEKGTVDVITLYNKSDKSIVIEGVELFKKKRRNLCTILQFKCLPEQPIITGNEGDYFSISIRPYDSFPYKIDDQFKFNLNKDDRLFIRLHLVGSKKPVTKLVCP